MNSLRVLHLSRAARIAAVLFVSSLSGAENPPAAPASADLRTLLRDSLFEEEATRDLNKAAAGYESLLTKWGEQRQIAATALFRLAEVRRKQDRKADAIALYQRLVTEFPGADPHARLSRENLAVLGAKAPAGNVAEALRKGEWLDSAAPVVSDEEATALARVQKLAVESPDLLVANELKAAADKGWVTVVKFIVSKNVTDKGGALYAASKNGHLAVVRELLTLKPLPDHLAAAAEVAADSDRATVLKVLLENGASPDGPPKALNPPLIRAIQRDITAVVDLLLAHKASVNPPEAETPPLFAAARFGHAAMVERLLALGADVKGSGSTPLSTIQPLGGNVPRQVNTDANNPMGDARGSTPLHAAVWSGSVECVSLLLKAKADPNAANAHGWTPLHGAAYLPGDTDIIQQLIAAGAKVDAVAHSEKNFAATPLYLAVIRERPAVVAALLKAGANPNLEVSGRPPLSYAVIDNSPPLPELRALLLAAGADPTLGNPSAIAAAPVPLRVTLLRSHQYPKLAAKPEITLVFGDEAREFVLAAPRTPDEKPDEKPAPLPALLLAWHDRGGWSSSMVPDWSTLRLFRKGDDGLRQFVIPIKAGADFPALQWGDVIEVVSKDWEVPPPPSPDPFQVLDGTPDHGPTGLPLETLAILRGGQSLRITFKSGDYSKDLTLRGVLRTYDLNSGGAPLQSLDRTVNLLAGPGRGMVKIERSAARGGGTVEWQAGSGNGNAFPEDGDIITFTPDPPEANNLRVSLRVTGQPGVWQSYGPSQSVSLLQFLSEFHRALSPRLLLGDGEKDPARRAEKIKALTPEELLANLIASGETPSAWPYLPWPDWSGVKVRRVKVENKLGSKPGTPNLVEGIPTVSYGEPEKLDLLTAMKSLTAESTPDDARKFDTILNPGDEVELPLLKDHPAGPWHGLDEAALRLFTTALTAKVTVSDPDGRFHEATVQWLPPRWVPTPAGVLPIPEGIPVGGRVHWIRALAFVQSVAPGMGVQSVSRQNGFVVSPNQNSDDVFLRPGDRIMLRPASGSPAPVATPRPGNQAVPRARPFPPPSAPSQ